MSVTFTATGADVVSSAGTSFNTNGPNQDGDLRITSGQKPFPDEYVIEFTATGEDANGELGGGSGITGIKVYASADDFANGIVLFEYPPQNPGQTATIQGAGSGSGPSSGRRQQGGTPAPSQQIAAQSPAGQWHRSSRGSALVD